MNTCSKLYCELDDISLKRIAKEHFGKDVAYEAKLLKGGLFNTTYYLKLIKENKELVLRVGPVNRNLLLPFEHNLMNAESFVYKLCAENGIPTSKVIVCDTEKKLIPRDYMIVEYIPGVALSEVQETDNIVNALYETAGILIKKMHAITSGKFGRVSHILQGRGFSTWSAFLKDELDNWNQKISETSLYTNEEIDSIFKVLQTYNGLFCEITQPHLIHADLWSGNVLVVKKDRQYEVAALIDADRAVFGDIDFEFASPWMINEAFLKGYGDGFKENDDHTARRLIYRLIYHLIDSYVWGIQYCNPNNSNENKANAMAIVHKLLLR